MKKRYLCAVIGIAAACLLSACAGGGKEPEKQEEAQAAEADRPEIVVGEDENTTEASEQGTEEDGAGGKEDTPEEAALESGGRAAGGTKEFAEVKEVGADFFTAAKIETEEFEDGSSTAVMAVSPDGWTLYDVFYTDETEFIVRSVSKDGMEYTDAPGSAADLETDATVNLSGSWEDGHFNAVQVIINHFAR